MILPPYGSALSAGLICGSGDAKSLVLYYSLGPIFVPCRYKCLRKGVVVRVYSQAFSQEFDQVTRISLLTSTFVFRRLSTSLCVSLTCYANNGMLFTRCQDFQPLSWQVLIVCFVSLRSISCNTGPNLRYSETHFLSCLELGVFV